MFVIYLVSTIHTTKIKEVFKKILMLHVKYIYAIYDS
jgi:hypothetical protein